MEIGIIGAGKVGCSMGKYMREHDLSVAGYFSRQRESSEQAGTFTDTKVFEDLESIVRACDLLLITTPDDVIGSVWEEVREMPVKDKIICHFSGSISSAVFTEIEHTGASGCSIHPMYAFSDKFTSYRQLDTVMFTVEGQDKAVAVVERLLSGMGNRVLNISPEGKELYHCCASLASNFMIGLFQMSLDLLTECGIPEETGQELLTPLVRNNMEAMLQNGTQRALSGPIERGDTGTVQKHLAVLREKDRQLYKRLGEKVLSVARRKNPERDYRELEQLFG